MNRPVLPGSPYPLGATWDGSGTNFALFSENAEGVELCLFDTADDSLGDASGYAIEGEERISLREKTEEVWHCYLPGVGPGQEYGYRVSGPYDPEAGHRFNPNKLLLDPYAKEISGPIDWSGAHFGYPLGEDDLVPDERDNAASVPKARVVEEMFSWGDDRPPRTPMEESVIYEAHVKGITALHPAVPEPLRGTYVGLASDAMIEHLTSLGVTAIELLPIHAFVDDKHLVDAGLRNYWGYNTLGFFAPESRYAATGDAVGEFKAMVKRMHEAGIEVILDVVYNHTSEGNHLGPTLSFRGIDNASYYKLVPDDPRHYMDYTGTGNSLDLHNPRVMQMVMDSLRYWVEEMHVDGFRFDLATTLLREEHHFDPAGGFARAVRQDPVLQHVKLIAEPWDVGDGGYRVGGFPAPFSEWNGKYRDDVRAYWKGEGGLVGELAFRITGSSDLYGTGGRAAPRASVNFVTAHDGFTLKDLVSYNEKHNEENGEENRDGESNNDSWNCGVEGPTDDPKVLALRNRQRRNILATLLLSQGVPMILAGDEVGRTQGGNNNAYCQDNEISWTDWDLSPEDENFLVFARRMVALRKEHPALRLGHFFKGRGKEGPPEVTWLDPEGLEMTEEEWDTGFARCLGLRIFGGALAGAEDDDLLVLFNAHHETVTFVLPEEPDALRWRVALDTSHEEGLEPDGVHKPGDEYPLAARSLALLRHRRRKDGEGK
ncbi:MAG: glycogen debranching enzyme GlgX [Actinobacteria bacterium]|nr:MAG: glycogen debranching enzyme GlgX [Actinomycetota bacterium]